MSPVLPLSHLHRIYSIKLGPRQSLEIPCSPAQILRTYTLRLPHSLSVSSVTNQLQPPDLDVSLSLLVFQPIYFGSPYQMLRLHQNNKRPLSSSLLLPLSTSSTGGLKHPSLPSLAYTHGKPEKKTSHQGDEQEGEDEKEEKEKGQRTKKTRRCNEQQLPPLPDAAPDEQRRMPPAETLGGAQYILRG